MDNYELLLTEQAQENIEDTLATLITAAQEIASASEKDFEKIKAKKWYKRLWELITFNNDNQKTGCFAFSFAKEYKANCLEKGRKILRALIDMAYTLKLKVVVEGVETLSQVEFLRKFDDCSLQGYYYSRPIVAEAFEALMK